MSVATAPPVTVSAAVAVTLPIVDVITVVPDATPVARPLEPSALLMLATAVADDIHVTAVVRSCFELSEKVPVAENCCEVPLAMVAAAGTTVRDTSTAGVIVKALVPLMLPDVALIVTEPAPTPLARPVLLIVARVASEELQATVFVTS